MTQRICIAGVPKSGKTTLASQLGGIIRHTDDIVESHKWSEASLEVAGWFNRPGPWLIEGVAVGRALRKWLAANRVGSPCDRVIWLGQSRIPLLPGQRSMAGGCRTVWNEIRAALVHRGVGIKER